MDGIDHDDEDVLRRQWAAAADAQDELTVSARLLEGLPDEGDRAASRARNLLLRNRPADALALLPQVSRDDVVVGRVGGWDDLIAAACWAAQGDERALGVLMRQAAGMSGRAAYEHAYLLGAAAEQSGRWEVADQAWRQLVDSGPVTEHVFVRAVAAQVARRDPRDATRAASDVVDAAQALLDWHGADAYGISRVHAVADLLLAREDRAGAALLTHALVRMRPGNERLAAVHRVHAVHRSPALEHGTRVAGVLAGGAVVALAVAAQLPGFVVVLGVGLALLAPVHRLRTARGLRPVDDAVLREVDGTPLDAPSGLPWFARAPWWVVLASLLPISALVAFLITFAVAVPIAPSDVELGDDPVLDGVVSAATVVLTVVVLALMLRLRRRNTARLAERRRTVEHRAWSESVGECRCWTDEAYAAPRAGEYLARHLRPSSDGAAALVAAAVDGATAAQCPLTGVRWLALHDAGGFVRHVLRGPAALAPAPARPGETGGYL